MIGKDFLELTILTGASILGFMFGYNLYKSKHKNGGNNLNEIYNNLEDELYYREEEISDNLRDDLKQIISCGLDFSPLRNPYISTYGYTYEKDTISTWLRKKPECPFTKQSLYVKDLRFNKNIFDLINFILLKERYNKKHPNTEIKLEEIFYN